MNSGIAQINGTEIYYEIHGNGFPLVLVEGLGVATWIWEKQIPEFSRHFMTIAYDNRGVGRSAKPAGPYSISMFAADLLALLDYLELEKVHLLGLSMGGLIAQEFALTHPHRLERLVLAATTHGGPSHIPMTAEALQMLLETSGNSREAVRKRLSLAYSKEFMEKEEVEHLIDLRIAEPQPREAFLAQAQAGAAFDRSGDVHRITAPTLILSSTGDLIVPFQNAELLAEKISNCKLIIYNNFGHQFLIENFKEFNKDVLTFLTQ